MSDKDEEIRVLQDKVESLRGKEDILRSDLETVRTSLKSVRATMTDWLIDTYKENEWPENSDAMRDAFATMGLEVPTENRCQQYRVQVSVECPVWADDEDVSAEFEDAENELESCDGVTYVEVTW
jgi:hypothetical protein